MAKDDMVDVVLSAVVFFEISRIEDTDTDEDDALSQCIVEAKSVF